MVLVILCHTLQRRVPVGLAVFVFLQCMMDPSVMNAGLQALFPAKVKKFEIVLCIYAGAAHRAGKREARVFHILIGFRI